MSTSRPDTHDVTARRLALASSLVVVAVVLAVFYEVTSTFGGTAWLALYVALSFVAASVAARRTPTRVGVAVAAAVFAVGLVGYAVLLPPQYYGGFTLNAVTSDISSWLTGRSVKLMLEADLWAVSVAPAPVFLTWYLAVRGRYDAAAIAGGGALGFFVLTGDLGEAATLVGMAGLLALLGFGAVATSEGSWRQLQEVGLVVGVVLLLTRLVQVVPASGTGGIPGVSDRESGPSLESTLLSNRDSMTVGGRPSLSPQPRFTIDAEERTYWHTRSFDTYTGDGWKRTDRAIGSERPLDPPPSSGTTLQQSVTVESSTGAMPAAWKPVLLGSEARSLGGVDPAGNLEPERALQPGTTYEVISEVPSWTEGDLADAGTDYRHGVVERYTQLPEGLPDRLVTRTEEIVADTQGPYETALTVQEWLTENKRYSLNVENSNWDIADAFVFALDAGYCVYFATTMAVMLRTQGIPARFTVGYAPGGETSDGRWLVRGYHSHAWVEVYFADVGWVTFDPTPAAPRQAAQRQRLPDRTPATTDATETPTFTPTPTEPPATTTNATGNDTGSAANGSGTEPPEAVPLPGEQGGNGTFTETPEGPGLSGAVQSGGTTGTATPTTGGGTRRTPGSRLWLLGALVTLAFGSVRLGYAQSALKTVWMRYQPTSDDPDADVERALARMEYHLESKFRPREEGETRQQYLADLQENGIGTLDDRAWTVLSVYHESQFGDGVDRATADRAVTLVNQMVR